jgi:hypothetical protein
MRQRRTVCDPLAHLPEIKAVGRNVVKDWTFLSFYHLLESTDRFLSINIDWKNAIRIV